MRRVPGRMVISAGAFLLFNRGLGGLTRVNVGVVSGVDYDPDDAFSDIEESPRGSCVCTALIVEPRGVEQSGNPFVGRMSSGVIHNPELQVSFESREECRLAAGPSSRSDPQSSSSGLASRVDDQESVSSSSKTSSRESRSLLEPRVRSTQRTRKFSDAEKQSLLRLVREGLDVRRNLHVVPSLKDRPWSTLKQQMTSVWFLDYARENGVSVGAVLKSCRASVTRQEARRRLARPEDMILLNMILNRKPLTTEEATKAFGGTKYMLRLWNKVLSERFGAIAARRGITRTVLEEAVRQGRMADPHL